MNDYEEKYKQALERASKLRVHNPFDTVGQMVEHIFPELAESDDERIKREILELVSIAGNGNQFEEIKDWLEKQGKHAEVEPKFNVGDWIILPLGIIARIDSINSTDYQVTTTDWKICDFKISKQDNYRLWTIQDAKNGDLIYVSTEEKGIQAIFHEYKNDTIFFHCYLCTDFVQGGYMPIGSVELIYPLQKTHYSRFFEKMHKAGYEWDNEKKELNKIEHKSADKIELKFNEGDWVIFNGLTLYVKEVVNGFYRTISKDGITNSYDWDIDNIARLWTIADAKEGDVLVDEDNNIGLYREEKDDLYWHSYIYIGCDNCLRGFGGYHNYENTKPATKEQRDILFAKIKELGYKWDSAKKELKKIEQNHVDKVEAKFHPGDWIIDNEYSEVLKITKSDANSYEITNQDGEVFDILKEDVECNHHLWTIADAKDGDVLVDAYGNIGIFDKCYDFDWMSCCSLGNNGGFQYFTVEHENEKTYPATEEQRNLFFSKMKEAGWEWDSKNKELKKNL